MPWPHDATRRQFLQSSGVGLAALMTPTLGLAGRGSTASRKAKSVIVLLLEGGMSHFETWDPKPQAPKEIRGGFGQIATSNPALTIGEHMPRLARQAGLYNVVRSVHSAARNHSPGLHWILTGYDNPAAGVNGQRVNTHPSTGAIVAHELGSASADGLPNFVAVPTRAVGRTHAVCGSFALRRQFRGLRIRRRPRQRGRKVYRARWHHAAQVVRARPASIAPSAAIAIGRFRPRL